MNPTTPPYRFPRWLRNVLLAVGFVSLAGLTAVVADVVANDSEATTLTFTDPVDRLMIDVASGDVKIVGSDEPGVTIEIVTYGGLRSPDHHETVRDGTLTIGAGCGDTPFTPTCSIDYIVHVPRGVDIVARGDGTDYDMSGISGDVDVSLDGGDAGMRFATTPSMVHARTGGGDISIVVPPRVGHHVVASSDGGSTHVGIATDPDSPYVIDAHSNGGDVTIERAE